LQGLRGVGKIVAASLVAEIGSFTRFSSSITKTGNSHVRRLIVESAWAYQHKPWIGLALSDSDERC
jgi:transposase